MLGSTVTVQELTGAVLCSRASCTEDERVIVRAAYRALAEGAPAPVEKIARMAGRAATVVTATLARWPGLAHFDHAGRLHSFFGLSLSPTPHQFEVSGRTLFTWCAWDSLFIPRLLQLTARVASYCPVTGDRIRVVVRPNGFVEAEPLDTVVSFITVCGTKAGADAVGVCCQHVHFLASADAAEHWLSDHLGGVVRTLDEAVELARRFVDANLTLPVGNHTAEGD